MDDSLDTKALWDISYGLYLVTSVSGGKANGQIVNSVIQVCAEKPRIAVSINKENLTHDYITKSGVLAVSVLEEDTPMTFIGQFGFKTGRDEDKFAKIAYEKGRTGCPIVTENALSWFEGKVIGSADAGTHTVFIRRDYGGEGSEEGNPPYLCAVSAGQKGKGAQECTHLQGRRG